MILSSEDKRLALISGTINLVFNFISISNLWKHKRQEVQHIPQ